MYREPIFLIKYYLGVPACGRPGYPLYLRTANGSAEDAAPIPHASLPNALPLAEYNLMHLFTYLQEVNTGRNARYINAGACELKNTNDPP